MKKTCIFGLILAVILSLTSCIANPNNIPNLINPPINDSSLTIDNNDSSISETPNANSSVFEDNESLTSDDSSTSSIPTTPLNLSHAMFDGVNSFIPVNNNQPFFTKQDITSTPFERYEALDSLGRCTATIACVGKETMPTEDRESISSVYPSGWKYKGKSNNNKYDFVDGQYIYNRCHLIGFQLTGENANEKNLITGTRYLNIEGMLAFENMIADIVKEDDIHVMYRVTPIYEDENLVPEGVLMEAYSVEDDGESVSFCIFCFNVQPGVEINYATGQNWLADAQPSESPSEDPVYILNTNTKKFHLPTCASASKISKQNKKEHTGTRESLIDDGYTPCGVCNP